MKTEPRTIASCRPSVLVFGAGLNAGDETVCGLYDNDTGHLVANITGKCKEIVFIYLIINFSFYSCYLQLKTFKGIKLATTTQMSCFLVQFADDKFVKYFLEHLSNRVPFYNDHQFTCSGHCTLYIEFFTVPL